MLRHCNRFLKEKERYEKIEADYRAREEDYQVRRIIVHCPPA